MIDGLKPYPAYKDSGLPWVGQVPEHWSLQPNSALMRRRKVLVGARHSEYQLLSLTKGGVIVRDVESGKGKFSADMGTCQEVRAGDLVFCLFDVPETPRTVGLSHHDGMITGAYTVFECSDPVVSLFLDSFYRAMDDRKLLSPLYSGLRNTIPPTRFLGIKTPLPPVSEQSAIVRFLDYTERRIRRYILAKLKLIKLLEEQKQVIIQHAVTRGLDLNVRTKPSGAEWLGEVPENWNVYPAKRLYHEVDERSVSGNEELLSVSHITGVTPRAQKNVTMFKAESYVGHKLCRMDDLVVNTMWAWMGALGVAEQTGIVSPSYAVYRPLRSSRLRSTYADLLLRTPIYVAEFVRRSTGIRSSRLRLYPEQFLRIPIPCPPEDEQDSVLKDVSEATRDLSVAIERTIHEIEHIREYRTSLVSTVVTGKLDVQQAAAQLPEEAPQVEPLDELEDMPEDDGAADSEELEAADAA